MKTDRRTIKTNKALKQALLKMLNSSELEKITISKLCETADVSRMAFYYHYEDIYHLYNKIEEEFFNEFSSLFDKSESHDYRVQMENLLVYLRDNADAVKHFATKSDSGRFRTRFASILEDQFKKIVSYEMGTEKMSDHLEYMVTYHSSGIYAVYMKWIESDFAWPNEMVLNLIHEIDEACDKLYYH